MTPLSTILATWFGAGFLKPAPGTWGSLAAMPFGIALIYAGNIYLHLLAIALVAALGLWSAHAFEARHGIADDKRIVIDEVAGLWIALLPATQNPLTWLAAFTPFRLFDILKPWPISVADRRIKGSFGVMYDDILAGLAAGFILLGLRTYVTGFN